MRILELSPNNIETTLSFVPERHTCLARLNLQLACKRLRELAMTTSCFAHRDFDDVFTLDPSVRARCVHWHVNFSFVDDDKKLDLPPHLWGLELLHVKRVPHLPCGLQRLYCGVWDSLHLEAGVFPKGLKWLQLDYEGVINPNVLPEGLLSLEIGGDLELMPHALPKSLKRARFEFLNSQLDPEDLPQGLRELHLEYYFEHLNKGVLPASLERLILERLEHPVEAGVLPEGLKCLRLPPTVSLHDDAVPGGLVETTDSTGYRVFRSRS